jgi:hypothetical protein
MILLWWLPLFVLCLGQWCVQQAISLQLLPVCVVFVWANSFSFGLGGHSMILL